MSALGNTSAGDKYPAVKLKNVGDSIAGMIVEFSDYEVKDYKTGEVKLFPSGDKILGVRITLETSPGDEKSRVTLWAEKINMLKAIKKALVAQGVDDLEVGGELAVTFSGRDGQAHTFDAAYLRPEAEASAA